MIFFYLSVILLSSLQSVIAEKRDIKSIMMEFFGYKTFSGDSDYDNDILEQPASDKYVKMLNLEKEVTAMRIEYIKYQILKKLRLKEKPLISMKDLQKTKEYANLLPNQEDHFQNPYDDDFYGKTTQAVIFPYEDATSCSKNTRFPSACLPFQMPSDIFPSDVSSAELKFYKEADDFDSHNQTFVISEITHWDAKKSFQKNRPIAIQETSSTENWLTIDITYVVKNWLEYKYSLTHAIHITCKTCGMDRNKSPISFHTKLKPFLIIYTHSQRRRALKHRRARRSSDCTPNSKECCRERLLVSFADIGWDNWIIMPKEYNAYFCRGSCTAPSALTLSSSQHNSLLQKLINGKRFKNRPGPEFTMCCSATQFSPLKLVYMDNNKTLTTKVLSNMIVDSCGCM
ncbi:growth/differentiation factor 8-like [Harmonia axyridis]|uniref:growth/differentiation factor 8-like n=1 Tax=Harmonia axyridis TaxID=115357 RepID=UPI001E277F79|nr:growth/differentiation factor 8-like [Harmonia axyridis]